MFFRFVFEWEFYEDCGSLLEHQLRKMEGIVDEGCCSKMKEVERLFKDFQA